MKYILQGILFTSTIHNSMLECHLMTADLVLKNCWVLLYKNPILRTDIPIQCLNNSLLENYNLASKLQWRRKKSGFHVSLRRQRLESATAVWKINESSAPFLLAPTWFIDNITFIFYSNIVVCYQKPGYCLICTDKNCLLKTILI